MATKTKNNPVRVLLTFALIALCALSTQVLSACSEHQSEKGLADYVTRYANTRTELDMAYSCIVILTPDAKFSSSVTSMTDTPDGKKIIELEPAVYSDTMVAWEKEDWAKHRDDLFFNTVAHFSVICKQASQFSDIPENYVLTCPDYMVVYDSKKNVGFVVTANGVYKKTDDPDNPIGEAVYLVEQE